jgi:predicted nucleotidyltransferase
MDKKRRTSAKPVAKRWLRGTEITLRIIRRFVREIVERFAPDKIILFGSQAYGTPHEDSDVDILVVMPARNEIDQAVRICLAMEYNFSLDLIVRTPSNLAWRLAEGDWFLREITSKGKVLYAKPNAGVDPESRAGLGKRSKARPRPSAGA